jgi:hypothetical protein
MLRGEQKAESRRVKYSEIIADELSSLNEARL